MKLGKDRREHPRYVLPSMYTAIAVRPCAPDVLRPHEDDFQWHGHAYDVSEGGMRFEIDEPIAPGTPVAVRLELPGAATLRVVERRPVFVLANVVWIEQEDLDQPGPVRMACVFRQFVQPGDRERLLGRLRSGRYSLAA
jgi:hypothetical protein